MMGRRVDLEGLSELYASATGKLPPARYRIPLLVMFRYLLNVELIVMSVLEYNIA